MKYVYIVLGCLSMLFLCASCVTPSQQELEEGDQVFAEEAVFPVTE